MESDTSEILGRVGYGNLEIARRWVQAINRGDVEALLTLCDSTVTFEPVRSIVQGAYRGHAGVREWWADTSETFESFRLEVDDLRDLGRDRVLALGTLRVRGQGSGADAEVPSGTVATFRDGRILALKDYGDHAKALQAAGLSE